MKIKYHSESFDIAKFPNCATGWRELQFTEFELLTAAYTVGRKNRWDVFAFGHYSYYEMIYRTAMILANLSESRTGHLKKTPAYIALDPSEKSAVSYFIGLAITKLLADKLLGLPYLLHLELFDRTSAGRVTYNPGKSRPDLINVNAKLESFIFECKGRSGAFDRKAMVKAKQQASKVISVDGNRPVLNVGCEVYFDNAGSLRYKWEDPNPKNSLKFDLLSPVDVIVAYYRPFFELVDTFGSIKKNEFEISLPIDIVIYLPKSIGKLFETNMPSKQLVKEVLREIRENMPKSKENPREVQMNDGIRFVYGKSWIEMFKKEEKKH